MPHDILVSIINYRTADLTINCVKSVLGDIEGLDVLIAIVDNASDDGSIEDISDWLAAQPEQTPVRLVRSASNSGFSGGHNQGIAQAEATYCLILNSDAILRPGFLRAIFSAAESQPKSGFIAPRLEGDDGIAQNSLFRFHSPLSELDRGAGTGAVSKLLSRHRVALDPDAPDESIEWASFACILLRTAMIQQIGPMDEGYFLYFEDEEYCLRARRHGWHVGRADNAVAVHYRGGSGPVKTLQKSLKRLPRYYYSSRTRFFYQKGGMPGLIAANLLWLLGRGVANLRVLVGRSRPPAAEMEARDIWTNVLDPLGPSDAPDK